MGASIADDGLSSSSSPGLSRGPIAAKAETLVPGTGPGMTVLAAISHYGSTRGGNAPARLPYAFLPRIRAIVALISRVGSSVSNALAKDRMPA